MPLSVLYPVVVMICSISQQIQCSCATQFLGPSRNGIAGLEARTMVNVCGEQGLPRSTKVVFGSYDTIPNSQTWSRLSWVTLEGLANNTLFFKLHDPERSVCQHALGDTVCTNTTSLLAASRWGLFFHDGSDGAIGKWTREPFSIDKCRTFYDSPVYFINILTWQVGHLLIDVLEPLFYAMASIHGHVDAKAYLVFNVANVDEREVLKEKMNSTIYGDTPFSLIRLFTDKAVRTRDEVASFNRLCFADVSLELDASSSYYPLGYERPSMLFGENLSAVSYALRTRYRAFKNFILSKLAVAYTSSSPARRSVVLIRRKGSRQLQNFDAIQTITSEMVAGHATNVSVVSLEELPFSMQLHVFQTADILIAQYGTAAHNVLFMQPGTVLLLLMQPGWCAHAWHFADQATLSEVNAVCVCPPMPPGLDSFRWTHRAWRQGPWISKDADFAVDEALFRRGLQVALRRRFQDEDVANIIFVRSDIEKRPFDGGDSCSCKVPRVHISDVRIVGDVASDAAAKVMLVPEIVGCRPPANESPKHVFLGLDRDWLELDIVSLCVTVAESLQPASCFRSSIFNEFSTIDLIVPWGTRLDLRCWIEVAGKELAESETYWTADINTEYAGLGVSTITHGQSFVEHQNRAVDGEVVIDWRAFRPYETLEIDVAPNKSARIATFSARLDVRAELQGRVAAFCRTYLHVPENCYVLARAVDVRARSRLLAAKLGLPIAQAKPTPLRPFVFLHNEKTAGSSLRRHIAASAKQRAAPFYVPCYDADAIYRQDERCYGFNLSNASVINGGDKSGLAVIAGHFQWGIWQDLVAWDDKQPLACLTMVRHPVDRAISFYYERVFQRDDNLGGKRLNDLDVEYFGWLLTEFRDSAFGRYRDEGMCDTMCKMLLGLNLYKGRSPAEVEAERFRRPHLFAALDVPLNLTIAANRLSQCVVGLQDDWPATARAISTWFPWIDIADDIRLNTGIGMAAETRETLLPELRSILEERNKCDLALYDIAVRIRHRQDLVAAAATASRA